MRYALKIAYDGTNYCGWQVQLNKPTVQGELQRALYSAFGVQAKVCASGRTDSGVHALAQVAHVDLPLNIKGGNLAGALNAHLPEDISVLAACEVEQSFDANRSAKKKTYCYTFYNAPRRNPLYERYALRVEGKIDSDALREAAKLFVGEHDFKAYCASGSQVKTTVRTVYSVDVLNGDGLLKIVVCGNGFLYNMVRTLAGTLLWYACDRLTADDIIRSLESGDRGAVGKTLPPKGLCLTSVEYAGGVNFT